MGVRGLTSYIARNAEQYLKPYELHDCKLVIDGDNLACNLYKDVSGTYSAFGGDYDDFYRAVVDFFHVLSECNVIPYVLMDGGYEAKKIRTVAQRLRGKITVIKKINPCGSLPVFPLHMKEVFLDALEDCSVPVMRCVFEADDELAALARKLNCPVLSYDSDFYIHNVKYIPLITLTIKAHTKEVKTKDLNESDERKMRRNEARRMEKRTKAEKIIGDGIVVDNIEKSAKKHKMAYKFLDCCIYRVENLFRKGSLSKEKLPLFAAMLGNDYIARSAFRNFFLAGMGKIGRSKKANHQQKRIRLIIRWLKTESLETALPRILNRLKKEQRESLLAQVQAATCGYSNEKCISYDFFLQNFEKATTDFAQIEQDEISEYDNDSSDIQDNVSEDSSEPEEDIVVCKHNEETFSKENELYNLEVNSENEEKIELQEPLDEKDGTKKENELKNKDETVEDKILDKTAQFPQWFLEKLYPAYLQRFFVDLLHLRKYINSPQIEHFPFNDCNEVALPILIYTFTLLHNVEGEETKPKLNKEGEEVPIEFTYLARAPRVTNVCYKRYAIEYRPKYPFQPKTPNPFLFRSVFERDMHKEFASEKFFEKLVSLPEDLRLYFSAIIYWLQKSQHCDLLHLHALIICLVTLRTNDSNIPPVRDLKAFQKRFGKIIFKEKLVRTKKALEGSKRIVREDLLLLSIPERMEHIPKSDCYLTQDNLLKHFHMQEIFKKKYDLYSSTVLHAFAEFQSVLYQLYGLNAFLNFPYKKARMGQLYCGVFLYNLYDLLKKRLDIRYYVENFIFQDSQMMFDFYCYLYDWCDEFIPHWKQPSGQSAPKPNLNKKVLKKQKQLVKQNEIKTELTNDDDSAMAAEHTTNTSQDEEDDEFYDPNNKYSAFVEVR